MIGALFAVLTLLIMGVLVTAFAGVWGVLLFVLALLATAGGAAT